MYSQRLELHTTQPAVSARLPRSSWRRSPSRRATTPPAARWPGRWARLMVLAMAMKEVQEATMVGTTAVSTLRYLAVDVGAAPSHQLC